MGLSLTGAKLIAMSIQMATLLFFSMLPIKVANYVFSKGEKGKAFLSCCRCFGGGALLGSFMLHMTPEIRYLLEKALLIPRNIHYPIPELIAAGGFFFFLLLEWFVTFIDQVFMAKAEKEKEARDKDRGQIKMWLDFNQFDQLSPAAGHADSADSSVDTDSVIKPRVPSLNLNRNNNKGLPPQNGQVESNRSSKSGSQAPSSIRSSLKTHNLEVRSNADSITSSIRRAKSTRRHSYHSGRLSRCSGETGTTEATMEIHSYHSGRLSVLAVPRSPEPDIASASILRRHPVIHEHDSSLGSDSNPDKTKSLMTDPEGGMRSLILLIALSADAFFQGMALGLQRSVSVVFSLLIAIIAHEFVVAFCLGLELVRSKPLKWVLIYCLVYGCTPAIGCAVGIGVFKMQGELGPGEVHLANGVLQSIAAGVFLYVAFVGILAEELTSHPTIISILGVILGFSVMAILSLFHVHDYPDEYPTQTPPIDT